MESASASSASAASGMQTDASGPQQHAQYFVDSNKGNIKEQYHFVQKLANGGFGIVYLAENRQTKEKFAVKAIQKKKVKDYTTFINEINILKVLVRAPPSALANAARPVGPPKHHQAARDLGVE